MISGLLFTSFARLVIMAGKKSGMTLIDSGRRSVGASFIGSLYFIISALEIGDASVTDARKSFLDIGI